MSVPFEIPDWLIPTGDPPAPDASGVDPHRVEDLVNRFIAGKQDALFLAPDAYYRTRGADAVDGAPDILDRLSGLKQAVLDAANDDGTRAVLDPRLDAHLDDARDGIDRHVAAQRDELTRQIISERQRLIQRAAQLEHNNDDKLAGLAEAHVTAAQELARMNGEPEAPAMDAARSAIWRTAIDQRLTNGNGPQAIDLFDRTKDQLAPDDRFSLDGRMQVARNDQRADQWIAGQTGTDGPPPQDRALADPNLSPDTKLIVRAKLDAQDSAAESKRVATVKSLDDQMADALRTLVTAPNAYKIGTISRLASAYQDAGEPDKAAATRRLGAQEAVLVPFAQVAADKQQRLIDSLPEGELRDTAIAIQRQQATARSAGGFQLARAEPNDGRPPDGTAGPAVAEGRTGSGVASVEPAQGDPARQAADRDLHDWERRQEIETDRAITQWISRASTPGYQPRNIPPDLEKQLNPAQRAAIERIMKGKLDTETDPEVYHQALRGLTSPYANERRDWARAPLYHLRQMLSPKDFADLVLRQHLINHRDGNPYEGAEPWGLRTQMALTLLALLRWAPEAAPLIGPAFRRLLKDEPSQRAPQLPEIDKRERGSYEPPNVEPPPGSPEAREAEEELRRLQAEEADEAANGPQGPP
jgi:hypothetical protein